jgi:hypothetical protein
MTKKTAIRWLAVAALFACPTVARNAFPRWSPFRCSRDTGVCLANGRKLAIADMGWADSNDDGTMFVHSHSSCANWPRHYAGCYKPGASLHGWTIRVADFKDYEVANRFNDYRQDESQRELVHRWPAPHAIWHLLVYAIAIAASAANIRRMVRERSDAWAALADELPSSVSGHPYR